MSSAAITYTETNQAIPQERGQVILGCLNEFARDPLAFFHRLMSTYPDIVEFHIPFNNMALVTSGDLSHQILVSQAKKFRKSDRDVAVMGTVLGKGLITNNDLANHKTQRKLVQPGFHFRRIESYAKTMSDYTSRMTQDWKAGNRDIADDMFKLTMYIVSKTLFDTDMEHMQSDANNIGETMHIVQTETNKRFQQALVFPDWVPTRGNRRLVAAKKALHKTISSMIETRKNSDLTNADKKPDMMSMLLEAKYEDGSSMPTELVMDELITLFTAGHETTSNALSWTFYLLALHPDIQAKLHVELDSVLNDQDAQFEHLGELNYTDMVIKESMRLLPPVWTLNNRQANEDIDIGSYHIPKDKVIFLSPYANHLNPRYFENPNRFDPERFSPENEKNIPKHVYIPFGSGPRVCIGQSFAMMEAKIILATIMRRFEVELDENNVFDPQPLITLSNNKGMQVKLKSRDN